MAQQWQRDCRTYTDETRNRSIPEPPPSKLVVPRDCRFMRASWWGLFLPSQDAGNAGTVNDTSLAVAKPASNPPMASPRALPVSHGYETLFLQGQQTGAQLHGFTNSMSTKSHAIVLNGGIEAQQQTRAVTPEQQVAIDSTAGKVVDTKEDQVGDTKAGKVESASINTQQVMPNRNICTPLDPVPSVYSR